MRDIDKIRYLGSSPPPSDAPSITRVMTCGVELICIPNYNQVAGTVLGPRELRVGTGVILSDLLVDGQHAMNGRGKALGAGIMEPSHRRGHVCTTFCLRLYPCHIQYPPQHTTSRAQPPWPQVHCSVAGTPLLCMSGLQHGIHITFLCSFSRFLTTPEPRSSAGGGRR